MLTSISALLFNSVGAEVLFSDVAVVRLGEKTYFLGDLNQLTSSLNRVRCLKRTLLLKELLYQDREQFSEIRIEDIQAHRKEIESLGRILKLINNTTLLNSSNEILDELKLSKEKCFAPMDDNLKKVLGLELFLRERFGPSKGQLRKSSFDQYMSAIEKRVISEWMY